MIGVVCFGKVGKNFLEFLKDLDFHEWIVYDDFVLDNSFEDLFTCDVIVICSSKKIIQNTFLKKFEENKIPIDKIKVYSDCFYKSYWLKNFIKIYIKDLQKNFEANLLKDTLALENLKNLLNKILKDIPKKSKNSSFYDEIYDDFSRYQKSYKQNIYFKGWEKSLEFIQSKNLKEFSILDIGCGEGSFAQMLYETLEKKRGGGIKNYTGIDFSFKALQLAKQRNPYWENCFIQKDIFNDFKIDFQYNLICLFEILEHIDDDLYILKLIPSKSYILSSVPNFYSPGHVRVFESIEEVKQRYGDLIEFQDFFELSFGENAKIFYFCGIKK